MKFRLADRALGQLRAAHDHIAKDSPHAATMVVRRIEKTFDVIRMFPYSGRVGDVAGTRQRAVPRTPYIVVYRVGAEIEVLSILHGRQRR